MNESSIKCLLIEPADKIICLLSNKDGCGCDNEDNLHNNWIRYFFELYNSREEFLLTSSLDIRINNILKLDIMNQSLQHNYKTIKRNTKKLLENKDLDSIVKSNTKLEETIFCILVFIFKYMNEFESLSIQTNLWNYCLKSVTFSYKLFIIGIITILCQYTWSVSLIYDLIDDFNINKDPLIITITIISTIISLFYSYESISSFISSVPLYKFLIKLYKENDKMILNKEETEYLFYKKRNINMKISYIYYNMIVDFLSNCLLPVLIPIINVFIILNSETLSDAILNCMAVFFIIKITIR